MSEYAECLELQRQILLVESRVLIGNRPNCPRCSPPNALQEQCKQLHATWDLIGVVTPHAFEDSIVARCTSVSDRGTLAAATILLASTPPVTTIRGCQEQTNRIALQQEHGQMVF